MGPRCVWESTLITKVRGGQRHILVEKPLEEGFFFFFAVEGAAGCRCHRKGHRNVGVGVAGKAVLGRGQGPVCSWAGRRMGGNRQGVCFRLDSRSLRAQGREVSSEVEVQA